MANYKTETVTTDRTIPVEFTFQGNVGGIKVRKTNSKYGDGMIGTGRGGYNYIEVSSEWIKLSDTQYKLHVWYRVYEDTYLQKKSNGDSLEFDAYKIIDFSSYYPVRNTATVTESWQYSLDGDCSQSAYYVDWFHGGDKKRWDWYPIDTKDYPTYNRARSWFPAAEIRIKMAGSGNDLKDAGNIGVKGIAYLKIHAVKTIRTKMEEASTSFVGGGSATQGSGSVLNLNNEYDIKEVLGFGYDMGGEYAVKEYLKAPVLDLNRLNNDKHILKSTPIKSRQYKSESSGFDELTKNVSESLKVEVKGSVFGATFSNTTEKTNSSKKTEKTVHKLVSTFWYHQNAQYKVDETNPALLRPYLTDNFKRDLSRLCSFYGKSDWDEELEYFMEKYGTHVLTGMITGGRVDLNMSYKQTTTNVSEAKSFSTVSSIGYGSTGKLKDEKGGKSSLDINKVEELLTGAKSFDDLKTQLNKLLKEANGGSNGGGKSGGSGGGSGISFSVSTAYNLKETLERATGEEINDFDLIMRGGNLMVNPFTDDNQTFDKWRNTLDQKKSIWCDYVPGRIIPLYKLAPDNNSMKILQKAWTTYCENHGIHSAALDHRVLSSPQTITGDKTCVKKFNDNSQDYNVNTSNDWPTGWKLTMDLVNVTGEKRMALAVRYQVVEGHKSQNALTEEQLRSVFNYDDVSDTNLVMERVIPISIPNAAVDTSKVVDHLEVTGVKKGDQTGVWVDVTNEVKRAINEHLTSSDRARGRKPMVEASSPYKFKIRLEGKGDDQNYLGLDFQLYLPYIKFNN